MKNVYAPEIVDQLLELPPDQKVALEQFFDILEAAPSENTAAATLLRSGVRVMGYSAGKTTTYKFFVAGHVITAASHGDGYFVILSIQKE